MFTILNDVTGIVVKDIAKFLNDATGILNNVVTVSEQDDDVWILKAILRTVKNSGDVFHNHYVIAQNPDNDAAQNLFDVVQNNGHAVVSWQ